MKINNSSRVINLDYVFLLALIFPITDRKFGVEMIKKAFYNQKFDKDKPIKFWYTMFGEKCNRLQ